MAKTVVISALHFPLTMARYMWEALEDRDDVKVWATGPFYNTYIPWDGGMHLESRYVKTPDFPLPPGTATVPAKFVNAQAPDNIDLWLDVDAGWCITGRPANAKVYAQIQTDPHVLKDRYRKFRPQYDLSFCMQTPYMDEGEIYLPYGYSKRYHYPEHLDKEYDVCLIGLNYQHRHSLVNKLRAIGLKVKSGIGIVYDEYRHEYNKSKIALSWSSLQDLPARVWEGMAMGLPVVTNRLLDLDVNGFVDGHHYLGFNDEAEAISQINFLLNNPATLKNISTNAYHKVVDDHSWDERMEFVLERCGVL